MIECNCPIHRKYFGLISDLEPRFFCRARGHPGADLQPDFNREKQPLLKWVLVPWSSKLDDPIPLPKGRKLVTLTDAANYIITKLAKAEHSMPEWQAAMEAFIWLRRAAARRCSCGWV
ncbi:MAG: hypothetical protein WA269_15645 [Candidatus Udaeobacter sp.]